MEARPGQLKTELVHLTNALAGGAPPASVHETIQARQILRKLLVGSLIFEPLEDAAGRRYHIRGQATYGRLLSGVVSVVPPG